MLTALECSRLFLKAWEDGAPQDIGPLFAEDGRFANPLQPKVLVGPAEITVAIAVGLSKIEDVTITVSHEIERGAFACVEGEFRSRRRNDGGPFDFPFCIVVEMRDGKIGRLTEYFDTARLR